MKNFVPAGAECIWPVVTHTAQPSCSTLFGASPACLYTSQADDPGDTAVERLSKSITMVSAACQVLSVSRIPNEQKQTAKQIPLCGQRVRTFGSILLQRLIVVN